MTRARGVPYHRQGLPQSTRPQTRPSMIWHAGQGYEATLIRGRYAEPKWPIVWRCGHRHPSRQVAFECGAREMIRRKDARRQPIDKSGAA